MKLFLGFYETDKSENALVATAALPERIWGSAEEQGFETLDQIQRLKPESFGRRVGGDSADQWRSPEILRMKPTKLFQEP